MSLSCYKIRLSVTGHVNLDGVSSAKPDTTYDNHVDVENGYVYMIAEDAREVAGVFVDALEIKRVGTGYEVER